jgi:uncharacterized protein
MYKRVLQKLSIAEIKPGGLVKRQLRLQASGLTGHITEIWTDLSDDSAWLGGCGRLF